MCKSVCLLPFITAVCTPVLDGLYRCLLAVCSPLVRPAVCSPIALCLAARLGHCNICNILCTTTVVGPENPRQSVYTNDIHVHTCIQYIFTLTHSSKVVCHTPAESVVDYHAQGTRGVICVCFSGGFRFVADQLALPPEMGSLWWRIVCIVVFGIFSMSLHFSEVCKSLFATNVNTIQCNCVRHARLLAGGLWKSWWEIFRKWL